MSINIVDRLRRELATPDACVDYIAVSGSLLELYTTERDCRLADMLDDFEQELSAADAESDPLHGGVVPTQTVRIWLREIKRDLCLKAQHELEVQVAIARNKEGA